MQISLTCLATIFVKTAIKKKELPIGPASNPSDALAYFIEDYKKGVNFRMFAHIPHILSLGNINMKGVNTINWSAAPVQT